MGFEACPGTGVILILQGRNSREETIWIIKTWSKVQWVQQDFFTFLLISVSSRSSSVNWSQTKFRHTHKHISSHRGNLGPNFAAFLPYKSRELVITLLLHILSNKQGKRLTSHFASCTVTLSLRQNFYHYAIALNLAKRIGKGKANGNHCPCTQQRKAGAIAE